MIYKVFDAEYSILVYWRPFFFFFFLSGFSLFSQDKDWIPKDSVTRKKAIRLIENNEGYHFFFNSKVVDTKKKVLLSDPVSMDELISQLVSGSNLNYQIKQQTIILFPAAAGSITSGEAYLFSGKSDKLVFKIFDLYTREPLAGAVISNKKKKIEEISELDGTASIDYNGGFEDTIFEIKYLGYKTKDILIKTKPKPNTLIEVVMEPDIEELGIVTVSGNLEKRLKEVNAQKNFINNIQVLAADTKDRLPDQNASEAIQRMSGATITRSYGEGNAIALRGTPISYSTVQYNGENLPATQVEGIRQVNLLGFGIDQIDNIHIVKTIRAEMDGDAIGGAVDLIPSFANSKELSIKSELGSGYNNLSKGYNVTGMVLLSKRFFNQQLGIKLGGNIYRTDNGRDRTEITWDDRDLPTGESVYLIDNYNFRDLENQRTRLGYNLSMDYRYGSESKLFFHLLYNSLTDKEVRNRLRYRAFRGDYINEIRVNGATIERDLRDRTKTRENISFQLGNRHFIDNWRFDSSFFYSKTDRSEEAVRATFSRDSIDLLFTDIHGDFPKVQGVSENEEDPSLYTLESFRPKDNISVIGENIAVKLDIKKRMRTTVGKLKIKGGIKYRHMHHKSVRNTSFFRNSGIEALNFSEVSNNVEKEKFMRGNLPFTHRIDTGRLINFFNNNPNEFREDIEESSRLASSFFSKVDEQVKAFFISAKLQRKKWVFLAGFRLEHNTAEYTGNEITFNEDESIAAVTPQIAKTNYTIPLPNFQLKYEINQKSQARFAFTFGYSRPDYNTITPTRIIDRADQNVFLGNPDLQPVRSANIDLAYEYYLGDIGVVSVSGFYKRITDFNYRRETSVTGNEWEDANLYTGYELETYENGKYANLFGLELNAQTRLKFLPGFLQYFTVMGNYSLTTSKAIVSPGVSFRLPGQAESFGNIVLSYDQKGFSTGLALNYNAGYTFSIGNTRDEDQLFDSRYQLDFNISQKINKNFRVYAEAINITDQPLRGFFGNSNQVSELEIYSWWVRAGIGWKF